MRSGKFWNKIFPLLFFRLGMKNYKLHLLTLAFLSVTSLYSQEKVTIAVFDTQGNALSYPEVILGTYVHRVGTEKGTLDIPLQFFNPGDTLIVKYLGFKTSRVLLDDILCSKNMIKIALEEDSFLLDPVIVTPSNFSGKKYFDSRIKNSLTPYSHKYFFDVDFVFKDQDQVENTYEGKTVGKFRHATTEIDKSKMVVSATPPEISKLVTSLKRATEISYLMANAFCSNIEREYFDCFYRGEMNNLELWEFLIKKQEKMPWNLERDDEYKCMVSLDKNGIIKSIKTQRISSSDRSFSYLLDTEFTLYEEQLIPQRVTLDFIPNANNEDYRSLSLIANYSNFRKRK